MFRVADTIVDMIYTVILSFVSLIALFIMPPIGILLLFGLYRFMIRDSK